METTVRGTVMRIHRTNALPLILEPFDRMQLQFLHAHKDIVTVSSQSMPPPGISHYRLYDTIRTNHNTIIASKWFA
jgi:hypothetical protein